MQDIATMKKLVQIVSYTLAPEDVDALFVVEACHKMMQQDFLKEFFGIEAQAGLTLSFFQKFLTTELYQKAERSALESAESFLTECKDIIVKLNNTCAPPQAKDLAQWATFQFTSDFPAALGTLQSTGKTLLFMQVQFIYAFMKFLRSASVLGDALNQNPTRKERKITPEWCEKVLVVRTDVQVLDDFLNMPKVKAEGDLFKDPSQQTVGQMLAGPTRSSLGVRLNTGPVNETMKSAIGLVTKLACDWEADTEAFMKLVDSWMPTGWEQNINDVLQAQNKEIFYVLLNGSYTKVGKSGLLLNTWRARLKSINAEPRLYTIDFLKNVQNKITECQQYCDLAYSVETIVKTIPTLKSQKQISDMAYKTTKKKQEQKNIRRKTKKNKTKKTFGVEVQGGDEEEKDYLGHRPLPAFGNAYRGCQPSRFDGRQQG